MTDTDNVSVAHIEGYAAIYHERDLNGDIVAPGAFTKSLKAKAPVRMLYQHTAEAPIGRWVEFSEDARGLYACGEILLESPRAKEIADLISGGAIDGLSIGYRTVRADKSARGGRRILEADLWEVSVVTFPMAPAARILRIGEGRASHTSHTHHFSNSRRAPLSGRLDRRASQIPHAASWDARHFAETLRAATHRLTRNLNPSV